MLNSRGKLQFKEVSFVVIVKSLFLPILKKSKPDLLLTKFCYWPRAVASHHQVISYCYCCPRKSQENFEKTATSLKKPRKNEETEFWGKPKNENSLNEKKPFSRSVWPVPWVFALLPLFIKFATVDSMWSTILIGRHTCNAYLNSHSSLSHQLYQKRSGYNHAEVGRHRRHFRRRCFFRWSLLFWNTISAWKLKMISNNK